MEVCLIYLTLDVVAARDDSSSLTYRDLIRGNKFMYFGLLLSLLEQVVRVKFHMVVTCSTNVAPNKVYLSGKHLRVAGFPIVKYVKWWKLGIWFYVFRMREPADWVRMGNNNICMYILYSVARR
ncbi:hypothetical protein ACFE04_021626 [Oxalis oulophora]